MRISLACVASFGVGLISALLTFRLLLPEVVTIAEYIRIEKEIRYSPDGTLSEAYFSYPSYEEYFDAISKESGITIISSDLPQMSVGHSFKMKDWHSVIRFAAPPGYESIQVDEHTYRIQKKGA